MMNDDMPHLLARQTACILAWITVALGNDCKPTVTERVASSAFQTIMFPTTEQNTGVSQQEPCTWVIRSWTGDVIGMRVTDWFTPSRFTCSRDHLTIRDGDDADSPKLRVVCGAFNNKTEVVTSSSAAHITYVRYKENTQRGFVLVYRSMPYGAMGSAEVMYTAANYVLMFVSVIVIGSLVGGLVYLYLRELGRSRRKKQQHMMAALRRRRQAFSGQSGRPAHDLPSRGNHCNNDVGLEVDSDDFDDDNEITGHTDLEPSTERTHVLFDGAPPT